MLIKIQLIIVVCDEIYNKNSWFCETVISINLLSVIDI